MKQHLKSKLITTWRIIVAIGMIAITALAVVNLYEYYRHSRFSRYRPPSKYTTKSEYSDSYLFEYNKGTVRTKNTYTGEYISPQMTRVFFGRRITDTLTVFFDNDKRGFLNIHTGEIAIPAQYERAWVFSEGLGGVVSNDKLGFVNHKGDLVIPHKFKYLLQWKNSVDFVFKGGYCTVIGENNKHGLIDKSGEWVIEPQYDYINKPVGGYRMVCNKGKYGLLDQSLRMIVPIEYNNIIVREDGFLVRHGSEQKLLALDGQTVLIPLIYDKVYRLTYGTDKVDANGKTILVNSEYIAYKVNEKWGILDKNGRRITKAEYVDVDAIKNDLFRCEISDGCNIIVNSKGEVVQ